MYACKTIAKSKVPDMELLRREVYHLRTVHHPFIIEFEDVFEDSKNIHVITELVTGGELYEHVLEKAASEEKHFAESDAVHIIRNILDAISYCHDVHHIVHRDLKASNFLFLTPETRRHIKIIDFGLSRFVPRKRCGSQHCPSCNNLDNKHNCKVPQDKENIQNDEEEEECADPGHLDKHTTCSPVDSSVEEAAKACGGLGVMSSRVGTPYYVGESFRQYLYSSENTFSNNSLSSSARNSHRRRIHQQVRRLEYRCHCVFGFERESTIPSQR